MTGGESLTGRCSTTAATDADRAVDVDHVRGGGGGGGGASHGQPEAVARFQLLLQQLADEHDRELAALRNETQAKLADKIYLPTTNGGEPRSPWWAVDKAVELSMEAAGEVEATGSMGSAQAAPRYKISKHPRAVSIAMPSTMTQDGKMEFPGENLRSSLGGGAVAEGDNAVVREGSNGTCTSRLSIDDQIKRLVEGGDAVAEGGKAVVREGSLGTCTSMLSVDDQINRLVEGQLQQQRTFTEETIGQSLSVSCGEHLVNGKGFGLASGAAVVINTIYLGVQADILVRHEFSRLHGHGEALPTDGGPFFVLDFVFWGIFFVELMTRWICLGWRKFLNGSDKWWHFFDTIVLLTSALEIVGAYLGLSFGSGMSALRSVRLVRILRLVRLANSFPALRSLVRSMQTMLHALSGVVSSFLPAMLILCICIYIFGLIVLDAVRARLMTTPAESSDGLSPEVATLFKYYSSVSETLFTLLAAVTAGSDWLPAAAPLAAISPFYKVIFQIYIIFVLICMLNVIAGLFVSVANTATCLERDFAIEEAIREEHKLVEQIAKLLIQADEDDSGTLSISEILQCVQNERVRAHFQSLDLDASSLTRIFHVLDADRCGEVEIRSFVKGCLEMRGLAKQVDIAMLLKLLIDLRATLDRSEVPTAAAAGDGGVGLVEPLPSK